MTHGMTSIARVVRRGVNSIIDYVRVPQFWAEYLTDQQLQHAMAMTGDKEVTRDDWAQFESSLPQVLNQPLDRSTLTPPKFPQGNAGIIIFANWALRTFQIRSRSHGVTNSKHGVWYLHLFQDLMGHRQPSTT